MTLEEFAAAGENVGREAGVLDTIHGYFKLHVTRLHQTCAHFGLFSGKLGDVLEIGPFFGYTPFILRRNSTSYAVLEGPDPAVRPLAPVYQKHDIGLSYVDFFEVFGPTRTAPHALALPDAKFDTILCWETMEHFNFNPVKFLREVHRILKPGGKVCITVPNKASFQNIVGLLAGRGEKSAIDNYFGFENYESDGKKAFYGFHWREYSPTELSRLFTGAGFKLKSWGTFTTFQDKKDISFAQRMARNLSRTGASLMNRHGTHAYVIATR